MSMLTRRAALAALAAPAFAPGLAHAAWPERPITWVVPFASGGITDGTSRIVAQKMSELLGQPIVVENRAGASGTIGSEGVSRAAPDGHTVLYGTVGTHAVQPVLNQALRYDPLRDFLPVHGLGTSPNMLVVPASKPWRTMADLVDHAKRHPDALNYGSSGVGTSLHLCGELMQAETGARATHAPYVNGAQAISDLIGGRLDFMFDFPITSMPHVREGRLRALAVTDTVRVPLAPDIPTTTEAGFPGVTLTSWAGLFYPARTPAPIVARLAEAAGQALRDPKVVEYFNGTATTLWAHMDTARFTEYLAGEVPRMRRLLERAGATKG
jgi:tripartite-type tricarboxylate transporter receptor subunit TctC